ncbi:MAG: polyprenyl synthetase family protein [Clostridia bacterium]|nr:polyprenyl synthetase family protein [Clostridia bacterium]
MSERYDQVYDVYRQRLEQTLERILPSETELFADEQIPQLLADAMRYSLLAGGKRVRPIILLATTEMLGGSIEEALPVAAALEMIHNYSLIHDDLPGMDDDDMRRGRPTNHKVYGVGQAILAGDGLLNLAYETMLKNALLYPDHAAWHLKAIREIAVRAGVTGMIAGQCIDLISEHMEPDFDRLRYIDRHKTADLLTAPLMAAAALSGASDSQCDALRTFGTNIGIAFQIDDDLLDIEGDAALLGKATGMDAKMGKMTWPAFAGVDGAKAESAALWTAAERSLDAFGERAWFHLEFARALSRRKY